MTDEQAFRRIAVLGDSIAVHRGDPVDGYPTQTWAERLVLAFAPDAYLNLGVHGARAAEIRLRSARLLSSSGTCSWMPAIVRSSTAW